MPVPAEGAVAVCAIIMLMQKKASNKVINVFFIIVIFLIFLLIDFSDYAPNLRCLIGTSGLFQVGLPLVCFLFF